MRAFILIVFLLRFDSCYGIDHILRVFKQYSGAAFFSLLLDVLLEIVYKNAVFSRAEILLIVPVYDIQCNII